MGSESAISFVVEPKSRELEEHAQTSPSINPTTLIPDTTVHLQSVMSGFCKFTGNVIKLVSD